MRAKHFDPGTARFVRCGFGNVRINTPLGTHCHFVGCTFSGRFDANISADAAPHDSVRRCTVQGNDFSQVVGLDFQDGVDWRANRFDLGHSQLILQAGTAFYRACEAMEGQDAFLDGKVGSLARPRRGPIGYPGQDWALLQEALFPAEVWERLLAAYGGPFEPGKDAPTAGTGSADPMRSAAGIGRPEVPNRDLVDADLVGANLAGADLQGAVLRGANLRTGDLTGANLTGADLTDADAAEAALPRARLAGAVLCYALLIEADLTGADLTGADLTDAELGGADAAGASLAGAVLTGAGLRSAILANADLRGAVLTDADLRCADLTGADLRQARLEGADLREAVLTGADLAGVRHGPSPATGRLTQWPNGYAGPPEDPGNWPGRGPEPPGRGP
jgi:uncharacterized protein YjbI with pentapeptide repeats